MKVKFIEILEDKSGTSSYGDWRNVKFLVETVEEKPKKVAFDCKGDTIDKITRMKPGDVFNVKYALNSREYNGKWYTSAVVFAVTLEAGDPPTSAYTGAGGSGGASTSDPVDDLPF